jgi:hypothetical protein
MPFDIAVEPRVRGRIKRIRASRETGIVETPFTALSDYPLRKAAVEPSGELYFTARKNARN